MPIKEREGWTVGVAEGDTDNGNDKDVERTNILVVDDRPEQLLVFRTILEELGQNLVFVKSGREALGAILAQEFAVILLDVNMPDLDGLETAKLIRDYRRAAHTPIIFVTAYADELQTARGYSLGAVDYILAPVNPQILRTKVKVFVELNVMRQRERRQAEQRVALATAESARKAAEGNARRAELLSHASRVLSGTLDAAIASRQLLELVVPRLAPFAMLVPLSERQQAQAGLVCTVKAAGDGCDFLVLSEGDLPTQARDGITLALERSACVDLEDAAAHLLLSGVLVHARIPAAKMELQSVAAVPLLFSDKPLGVLFVADRRGNLCDRAALEELASRAAIAFENARLVRNLQVEVMERQTAEEKLRQASRRKDEFLAMLSHELRNPLAPISNAIELVRRMAPNEPKIVWAGEVMDRQVKHLTQLVEELLDVARIGQGKIALKKESFELSALLAHAVETARPGIEARGHKLRIKQPEKPVWLQGDFGRLAQSVGNLLSNAAKYTEKGGAVDLTAKVEGGTAIISVRDNGIGIDAELLPRIFELFEQGERGLDRSQGGLGVGLSVARSLVEAHHGRLEASSQGVGKGSEFRIFLPCVTVVQRDGDAKAATNQVRDAGGVRVLIVEDNMDAAESAALYLNMEGHSVKAVHDGKQALDCARVFAPQVVVLDIGLPVVDGYAVARALRAAPETRSALLIALTGYGQKEDIERAMEAGFDLHLVKPADLKRLAEMIGEFSVSETRPNMSASVER